MNLSVPKLTHRLFKDALAHPFYYDLLTNMTLNQFASSYNYQELADDSKKYLDASSWIENLSPEVKDLWLERFRWIGLVTRLAVCDFQQGGSHYQQFKHDWNNFVSGCTMNQQSKFQDLFERMDLLWFRQLPLPDWSTIKAWDNYLKAIGEYHKPGLVIETVGAYDQMLERLSGSLFQILPFVNKRYWTEVRYLGVLDQVYNHITDLASDAERGICYFPEDLLSRYSLKREQFLDGRCINKPEYQELMHYWLDVYLPHLKHQTHRLIVATDLHPSWLVMLEWMLKRHHSIEFTFRWYDYDYTKFLNWGGTQANHSCCSPFLQNSTGLLVG